jgi:hypothetical protein
MILRTLLFLTLLVPAVVNARVEPLASDKCAILGITCSGADDDAITVYAWIDTIMFILLGLVGLIAVIAVIYGGVRYILSGGDEDAAKDAKRIILYAVIGLIVIGLSAAIVNFVIELFSAQSPTPLPLI